MAVNGFNSLRESPDYVASLIQQDGQHTAKNYSDLYQLACLDRGWRDAIAKHVAAPLLEGTQDVVQDFVLKIDELYGQGDLTSIVVGLLRFYRLKSHHVQLRAVTALYTACCTDDPTHETQRIEQIVTAGGVEAVIGSMVMNTSDVPLNIVCINMLTKMIQCRNDTVRVWTERQYETAMLVILGAMRKFYLSFEIHCCAMSWLLLACSRTSIVCKKTFRKEGGLHLLLAVMRQHNDETLHMNIFKIMEYFAFVDCPNHPMTPEEYICIYGENQLQLALQNSVADGAHLKTTPILLKLIDIFSHYNPFLFDMCENPLTISVCLQVLKRVCAVTHTDTRAQAIEIHEIIYRTAGLFARLAPRLNESIRHIVMHRESIQLIVQALSASFNLSIIQPPLLDEYTMRCHNHPFHKTHAFFCKWLLEIARQENMAEFLLHVGVLPILFGLIKNNTIDEVLIWAIQIMHCIAFLDNAERLLILKSGGLEILALIFTRKRPRYQTIDIETCDKVFRLLLTLAAFPVYATAMMDMGFYNYMTDQPHFFTDTNTFLKLLEAGRHYPVYPVDL